MIDKGISDEGKAGQFPGPEAFESLVKDNSTCFLCGINRSDSKEHIVPDWILKRFDLRSQKASLPNHQKVRYYGYKVPCCKTCNAAMGLELEQPISKLFKQGYEAVGDHIKTKGPNRLISWLALLYIKKVVNDYRISVDPKYPKNNEPAPTSIAEVDTLHHVYCLARTFLSKATWEPGSGGSFVMLPVEKLPGKGHFDHGDLHINKIRGSFLIYDDFCLISMFNDGGYVVGNLGDSLSKLPEPLTPKQVRETFCHFVYTASRLTNRPQFSCTVSDTGNPIIQCNFPKTTELSDFQASRLAAIKAHVLSP